MYIYIKKKIGKWREGGREGEIYLGSVGSEFFLFFIFWGGGYRRQLGRLGECFW